MIPLSTYERLSWAAPRTTDAPLSRRAAVRATLAAVLAAPRLAAAEPAGTGLRCDRASEPLVVRDCSFGGATAISCSVTCTPDRTDAERTLVGDHHDAGFCLRFHDGYAEFLCHNGTQYLRARSDERLEAYARVTLLGRCDGKTVQLFVDGTLQRQAPAWFGRYRASKHPVHVGADPDASGLPQHHFIGMLHEVRLRADARSDRKGNPVLPAAADRADVLWLDFAALTDGKLPDKSRFRRTVAVDAGRVRLPPAPGGR